MPNRNAKFIRRQEARLTARLLRRWKKQISAIIEAMKSLPFAAEADKAFFTKNNKEVPLTCSKCGTVLTDANGVLDENQEGTVTPLCVDCWENSKAARFESKDINDLKIGDLIDGIDGFRETVEDVVAIGRASYKGGSKLVGDALPLAEFGISFDITVPDAEAYLRRLRSLNLSNYKGSITRTTKDRIKDILTESVRSGRTYDETASLIRDQGKAGVFSKERGKLIAVNQVGNAHEEGKRVMAKKFTEKSGLAVEKTWQTSNDDRVTEECREYQDMGWIAFDAPFVSSSGTSDQRAPRKTNPRCRCNTAYQAVDTGNDDEE